METDVEEGEEWMVVVIVVGGLGENEYLGLENSGLNWGSG